MGEDEEGTTMAHNRLSSLTTIVVVVIALVSLQVPSSAAGTSSSFPAALQILQKQLGYEFQSIDLLRRAMTHPSYSRENFRSLSILGLGVVETSVSLRLLQKDLDVSAAEMSGRIREASDVDSCAAAGARLGLEKVVRVSARTNASAPAVVCGAFRAVFGGVVLDCGKVEVASEVFWRVHGGGWSAASDACEGLGAVGFAGLIRRRGPVTVGGAC